METESFEPGDVSQTNRPWMQRSVAELNEALEALRACGCRWWSYSVSHRTLEIVIGDAMARGGNLVIALNSCERIGGPVSWQSQQLRVRFEPTAGITWTFSLQDGSAGFEAVGHLLKWRRDYDLVKHKSLYFPQENQPEQNDE
jgi:hypothetical protein